MKKLSTLLNETFELNDIATVSQGDYKGLRGVIVRKYKEGSKQWYDVKITGGYCSKGSGAKDKKQYYHNIIQAEEITLKQYR